MRRSILRRLLLVAAFLIAGIALVSGVVGMLFGATYMLLPAQLLFAGAVLLFLLWFFWSLARRLLWRVGRRLALSYLLIGILPIPMVAALIFLTGYLVSGFFLGHLYRDTVEELYADLQASADGLLESFSEGGSLPPDRTGMAVYLNGRHVIGDASLPANWNSGLDEPYAEPDFRGTPRYYARDDGTVTFIATASAGNAAALVTHPGDLSKELMRRGQVWVKLYRSDDPRKGSRTRVSFGGKEYAFQPVKVLRGSEERARYFEGQQLSDDFVDKPWLWWNEISRDLMALEDGQVVAEYVTATLNGTVRAVARALLSSSAEVDTAAWAGLISLASLLAAIYAVALAMALFMIFTLSRAVNRLSNATDAVRAGDFAARIPVRRNDQVGELQKSFNQMAENLEQLVASAAQQEILEKELKIARDLQQSLLPSELPKSDALEFATLFEPSAAIGGDYFDILRIDESRLAVVIADVSGHGLPTGLRMAMIKAALGILVEESKQPREILRRLSSMIRADDDGRFFVTATVAVIDFRRGAVDLTNAGHPPTYLIRDGAVDEILLPGNPLGALGEDYGHSTFELIPGDVLVWLSDGLIEMVNPKGEPFGYDGIRDVLASAHSSAAAARDAVVRAVERHAQGIPPDDDQTLVALRYRAATGSSSDPSVP
ncbi:MAG: PP2C family protein-serine/threonine phosphatase [Thermoanaerobaculia bacterium]